MYTIVYSLSGRRPFIVSSLLLCALLVCWPTPRVRIARAAADSEPAPRALTGREAPPPSFSARAAHRLTGDGAESPVREVGAQIPLPPFGGGGGGEAKIDAELIAKNGPLFAGSLIMNNFALTAFMKGDWPFVISYSLEKNSTADITIIPKGSKQGFVIHLPSTNDQLKEEKYTLPDWFGDKPEIGQILFKARRNGPGPEQAARFYVEGVAGGPGAVGSLVVDQLQFRPGAIHTKLKEKAAYSFRSLRPFNKAAVEFLTLRVDADGVLGFDIVDRLWFKEGLRQEERVERVWNCKNSKGKFSLGPHQFRILAWRGLEGKGGGDWTFRYSVDKVIVE
jgi:hypothetical protein